MPANQAPTTDSKTYPAELRNVLERATQGDAAALPQLRKAFDDHPELVQLFGDLARQAEESLLAVVAGDCLTAKEAMARELADLRARLTATATTELERLLCGRVALCWLHVTSAEFDLAQRLQHSTTSSPTTRAAQQRFDKAHARFLSAVRALATIQKLKPGPSPLDLIRKPMSDQAVDTSRPRKAASSRFQVPLGVG